MSLTPSEMQPGGPLRSLGFAEDSIHDVLVEDGRVYARGDLDGRSVPLLLSLTTKEFNWNPRYVEAHGLTPTGKAVYVGGDSEECFFVDGLSALGKVMATNAVLASSLLPDTSVGITAGRMPIGGSYSAVALDLQNQVMGLMRSGSPIVPDYYRIIRLPLTPGLSAPLPISDSIGFEDVDPPVSLRMAFSCSDPMTYLSREWIGRADLPSLERWLVGRRAKMSQRTRGPSFRWDGTLGGVPFPKPNRAVIVDSLDSHAAEYGCEYLDGYLGTAAYSSYILLANYALGEIWLASPA